MANRTVGPISAPVQGVPRWALPPSAPPQSPIDFSKLLDKLLPPPDGEDMARVRTGIVDAVNTDGTVDVGISGLVVPDVPRLAGAPMVAGTVVNILVWRGGLLVLGPSGSGAASLRVAGTFFAAATNDLSVSTSVQSMTGCTFNFTTYKADAVLEVDLVVDFDPTDNVAALGIGYIQLDSTDITSSQALFANYANQNGRNTAPQNYSVAVASPGPHTMTARVIKSGSGLLTAKAGHTTIRGRLYETS